MSRNTPRIISWIKSARKDFNAFPAAAQDEILDALTLAADGLQPDAAKPMKGLGSGVYEIALRHRGDAYRTVYTLQIQDRIWVVHAFKKKSKSGIKTPKPDIDLIKERIKRIKEMYQ